MIIPTAEDLQGHKSHINSVRFRFPEFYEFINGKYNDKDITFNEKMYWYFHNIEDYPVCPQCGKRVTFICFHTGYHKYCSTKCSVSSDEIQAKIRKTNLERYGDEASSRSQNNKEKYRQTCLRKYGVDNAMKAEEIRRKVKQTCVERYGADCIFNSEEFINKSKKTCLERYGTEHFTSLGSEAMIEKIRTTKEQTFLKKNPMVISIDGDILLCRCDNEKCTLCKERCFKIPKSLYRSRMEYGGIMCTKANKYNSMNNSQLELFIRDILDRHNIEYNIKDRTLLVGRNEIDIYIPSKKVGIECNGLFWHNDLHKERNYHVNKLNMCRDAGIQLINIWEDWIKFTPELVESIILSKIGIFNRRIYARDCEIRKVEYTEYSKFLNINHLQGSVRAKVCYGLYYEGELISIMSFGKGRKCVSSRDEWELYRYCNAMGVQVIGGASRMLHHFIDEYSPSEIMSFSSNDISDGGLYEKLGFSRVGSSISYWYINQHTGQRFHRFQFTKKSLVAAGYDSNLTEAQIMFQRGYWRIWDSGQTKWMRRCDDSIR